MTRTRPLFVGLRSPRLRPPNLEIGAGGFSKVDGTVEFYSRVQALLPDHGTVLDFGAGRGQWNDDPCVWRRQLVDLRGAKRFVIVSDIDHAVVDHPASDAVVLLPPSGQLPFRSGQLVVVVADWVFEHIETPAPLATELSRVVAPGGWICARTPNKWGYVGTGAQLLPNRRHSSLLRPLQPSRQFRDVFPVHYSLNTRSTIAAHFSQQHWRDYSYMYNPDPDYVGNSRLGQAAIRTWQRIAPALLSSTLHVFLQRRPTY